MKTGCWRVNFFAYPGSLLRRTIQNLSACANFVDFFQFCCKCSNKANSNKRIGELWPIRIKAESADRRLREQEEG